MRALRVVAFGLLVSACQALLSLDAEDAGAVNDANADRRESQDGSGVDAAALDGVAPLSDVPADRTSGACPDGGTVWNGRCYFAFRGIYIPHSSAVIACKDEGAQLAEFETSEEWLNVGIPFESNHWIGATFDTASQQWKWSNGSPITYFPPGPYFDGGAPNDPINVCMWIVQSAEWQPVSCGASSANAYCERAL